MLNGWSERVYSSIEILYTRSQKVIIIDKSYKWIIGN